MNFIPDLSHRWQITYYIIIITINNAFEINLIFVVKGIVTDLISLFQNAIKWSIASLFDCFDDNT